MRRYRDVPNTQWGNGKGTDRELEKKVSGVQVDLNDRPRRLDLQVWLITGGPVKSASSPRVALVAVADSVLSIVRLGMQGEPHGENLPVPGESRS